MEALNNVVRHSEATEANVMLRLDDARGALILEVSDNGRGIEAARTAGVGMTSMRERASELGGIVRIASGGDGGTLVHVELPLAQHAPEE